MKMHLLSSLLLLAALANAHAAEMSEATPSGRTSVLGVDTDLLITDPMDRTQLALEVVCTARNSKYCCYYGNSGSLFTCSKWVPKVAGPKEARSA